LKAALGADNRRTQKAAAALAELYEAWGKKEAAATYRAAAGGKG
jgi:hypothetical protein